MTPKQVLESSSSTTAERRQALQDWARAQPKMSVDCHGNIRGVGQDRRIKLGPGSVRYERKDPGGWHRIASAPYSHIRVTDNGAITGWTPRLKKG